MKSRLSKSLAEDKNKTSVTSAGLNWCGPPSFFAAFGLFSCNELQVVVGGRMNQAVAVFDGDDLLMLHDGLMEGALTVWGDGVRVVV